MKKCLIPEERQGRHGKEVVIKYLRGELKNRLDYLNGEPDNLCKAYQTIIESMQHQLETRDIVKETHNFLNNEKIGFGTLIRAFNFFSDLAPEERDVVIEAYKNDEFNNHGWY